MSPRRPPRSICRRARRRRTARPLLAGSADADLEKPTSIAGQGQDGRRSDQAEIAACTHAALDEAAQSPPARRSRSRSDRCRDGPAPSLEPPARSPRSTNRIPGASRRYKIRDENGHPVVARLHGRHGRESVLMLPDGQLGLPTMLVPTDEPFRPLTADELLPRLQGGPLGEFQVLRTAHYLIFFRSTLSFAEASGRLLEDLYARLLDAFRKHDMPVHETEFPLVAVIYRTEQDFRAQPAGLTPRSRPTTRSSPTGSTSMSRRSETSMPRR